MKFVEIDASEFDKFRKDIKGGGFYQRGARAELREKMGWDVKFFAAKKDSKIAAAGLSMMKDGNAILQLGPLMKKWDVEVFDFFIKNLTEYYDEEKAMALEVYPPLMLSRRAVHGEVLESFDQDETFKILEDEGFKYKGATVATDPKVIRWMTTKDLSEFKTLDEARASYKKNARNKLRKISKDLKIYVVKDKTELKDWILPLKSSNEKNHAESWGREVDYYEDMWDAFGDQVQFMEVRRKEDDKLISSRVVLYFDDETITFSSGTIQELRKMNGMTFLQDWQIGQCIERGQKRINFYGVDGDFSKDNHLLEFKSGFGVEVEEYIGGFIKVLNPAKYYGLKAARKVKREVANAAKSGLAWTKKIGKRQTKVVRKVKTED